MKNLRQTEGCVLLKHFSPPANYTILLCYDATIALHCGYLSGGYAE
jgi:hypothetical protein